MKKLAQFSIDYPVTVAMIILGIVLLGFISFSRLGTDLFPDLNNPRIVVEVESGERPPEEMEKQFVEQMEGNHYSSEWCVKCEFIEPGGFCSDHR